MHLELYINGKLLDKTIAHKNELNFQKTRLKMKWRSKIKSAENWFIMLACSSKLNKQRDQISFIV